MAGFEGSVQETIAPEVDKNLFDWADFDSLWVAGGLFSWGCCEGNVCEQVCLVFLLYKMGEGDPIPNNVGAASRCPMSQ